MQKFVAPRQNPSNILNWKKDGLILGPPQFQYITPQYHLNDVHLHAFTHQAFYTANLCTQINSSTNTIAPYASVSE